MSATSYTGQKQTIVLHSSRVEGWVDLVDATAVNNVCGLAGATTQRGRARRGQGRRPCTGYQWRQHQQPHTSIDARPHQPPATRNSTYAVQVCWNHATEPPSSIPPTFFTVFILLFFTFMRQSTRQRAIWNQAVFCGRFPDVCVSFLRQK